MGVRSSTPVNLSIGAGKILVDQASKGASAGDNSYRIEQEFFVPDDINGLKGELLGTRYVTRDEAHLDTAMPEVAEDVIALLWPISSASTVGSDRVIRSDDSRRVPTSAYHDYELRVPRLSGGHFGFHCESGIMTGNAEFTQQDKGMSKPKVTVKSTWDPNDLTRSPHFIVIASSGS